jgi:methylglutaconyl-CoA hydratase
VSEETLLEHVDEQGVCTVTMNRPELHNAFDDALIAKLKRTFDGFRHRPEVRVVVLAANGKSFSAGADMNWMKCMVDFTQEENFEDATGLAEMLDTIYRCPKPTIAYVHGAAFGGGVGLAAACDIALASERAIFCLSEVRIGLIPATISPYVMSAMGERACRRYFITGERFTAVEAHRLGLVHEVCGEDAMDAKLGEIVAALLQGAPLAQAASKDLTAAVANRPIGPDLIADTAARIAAVRVSDEGQEGLEAFLGKRKPVWVR